MAGRDILLAFLLVALAAPAAAAEGWYRIPAIPGRYDLRFSLVDFGRVTKPITVANGPVVLVTAVLTPALTTARPGGVLDMVSVRNGFDVGVAAADARPVNEITVGSDRSRRTLFGMSPRSAEGRLFVALETLRMNPTADASERDGSVNGIVRYSPRDSRQGESITGRVQYARQTRATSDAQLLSFGVTYQREWAPTSHLRATAGLQGDLHRFGDRAAGATAAETRTAVAIGPTLGVAVLAPRLETRADISTSTDAGRASRRTDVEWLSRYHLGPWLTLDGDLTWSWARVASVGVSVGEVRRWTAGVRLLSISPRSPADDNGVEPPVSPLVHAKAGYGLTPRSRLALDVLNLTNARVSDVGDAVDGYADWAPSRTVRLTMQFGL